MFDGPCPDRSDPGDDCVCSDGTRIAQEKCPACGGDGPEPWGALPTVDATGFVEGACAKRYAFTVAANTTALISIADATSNVSAVITSSSLAPEIASMQAALGKDAALELQLQRGEYSLQVRGAGTSANYRLVMRQTPYRVPELDPEPGESDTTASPIGAPTMLQALGGYVGVTDPEDFYQFTLPVSSTVTFGATEVRGHVDVQLFAAAQGLNVNQPLRTRVASTNSDDISTDRLERGAYYVRVVPHRAVSSLYELRISAKPHRDPEPEVEPAADWTRSLHVGALTSERLDIGGYVGPTDARDYYRFELTRNATLMYTLGSVEGAVSAALYQDATQIDTTKPLDALRDVTSSGTRSVQRSAGVYHLLVTSADPKGSLYTLSLSATTQ